MYLYFNALRFDYLILKFLYLPSSKNEPNYTIINKIKRNLE